MTKTEQKLKKLIDKKKSLTVLETPNKREINALKKMGYEVIYTNSEIVNKKGKSQLLISVAFKIR